MTNMRMKANFYFGIKHNMLRKEFICAIKPAQTAVSVGRHRCTSIYRHQAGRKCNYNANIAALGVQDLPADFQVS